MHLKTTLKNASLELHLEMKEQAMEERRRFVRQRPLRHDGREKPRLGQVEEGVGSGFGLIATGRTFVDVRGLSWGIAERLCLETIASYFLFDALCVFDGSVSGLRTVA